MKSPIKAVLVLLLLGTSALYAQKVPVPATGCYLSAFTEDGIQSFETLVGKKQAVAMFYTNWEDGFPTTLCEEYASNGNIPHLSWEPYRVGGTENDPSGVNENSNAHIIAGDKDAYITQYAKDAAAFLEMNGDWYEWGGAWSGKDTMTGYGDPAKYDGAERFVDAWKHIHDIFVNEGATNVSWVFAPNVSDEPSAAWNRMELYYPGAAYVDWLAIDGYNWGGSDWQSFDEVFSEGLPRIEALGTQPIMIAEFATSTTGGNKAAWITETYASIKENHPRIKAVTWFHIIKEEPWGVNTTPEDLAAFKASIADPYFLSAPADDTQVIPMQINASSIKKARTSSNNLLLSSMDNRRDFTVGLFNLSGKAISSCQSISGRASINLSSLSSGLLLLRTSSTQTTLAQKIINQ